MKDLSAPAYRRTLCAAYLGGVVLLLWKTMLVVLRPGYPGLLPYRGIDESLYLIRLQEGLFSPSADTTGGIWTYPSSPPGIQMAGMERVAGWLFGWTGLRAPEVALVITAFAAPLLIVLCASLARRLGVSRLWSAVTGVMLFTVLGFLPREFNPSWSMPLMTAGILTLFVWWERPVWTWAVLGGFLLGLLPGTYFWAWTYAWAFFGMLLLLALIVRGPLLRLRVMTGILSGVVALLTASPILLRLLSLQHNPLFAEVSARMGLIMSHELESPVRSLLLLCLAAGTVWTFRKRDLSARMAPLLALVLASLLVAHQQLIHGRILSFSSHYYPYHCLAAVLALAALIAHRRFSPPALVACCAAALLLAGAWKDYNSRLSSLFPPAPLYLRFAHLAPALALLQGGARETVLTDRETANMVASHTNDDVVYTDYARILLIPTRELARRYCLTEAFGQRSLEDMAAFFADFNEEHSRAGVAQTQALYRQHYDMIKQECADVRAHIPEVLQEFGVTTLLWNQTDEPDWKIDTALFRMRWKGAGWSVWERR